MSEVIRPLGPIFYCGVLRDKSYKKLLEKSLQPKIFNQFDIKIFDVEDEILDEIKIHVAKYYLNFHNVDDENNIFSEILKTKIEVVGDFWSNNLLKKQGIKIHNHTGEVSLVAYIKLPSKHGTNFIFGEYNSFMYDNYYHTPEEGHFLLFPSWVKHYVDPIQDDEERITISANFKLESSLEEINHLKSIFHNVK
jgi:hypothetical protein